MDSNAVNRFLLRSDSEYRLPWLRDARVVFLTGEVYSDDDLCRGMMQLALDGSGKPITLIISSEGGDVFAGLAVIEAIRFCRAMGSEVHGMVWGQAMSMGCVILQACTKRLTTSSAVLMMHGPKTGAFGDIKNIAAEKKLMDNVNRWTATFLADKTGKPEEYWALVLEASTPNYYTAEEAKEQGLVDEVVGG